MIRAKNGIYRCLTTRMSTVHPWMVCCDIHMPREVFDLFCKGTMNLSRCSGNELEKCGSVTTTFTNMRRVCVLCDKFKQCNGFTKELGVGRKWLSLELGRKQYTMKNKQYRVFVGYFDFMYLK